MRNNVDYSPSVTFSSFTYRR